LNRRPLDPQPRRHCSAVYAERPAEPPAAKSAGTAPPARTGRLARRDPHWTPARTGLGLIRDPATLAPAQGDVPAVLAAVHHATDAIAHIAAEDQLAVRQAAADGRLYVPATLLPAQDHIPYQHAPIRRPGARRLLATYAAAIEATTRATRCRDDLAVIMGAPSRGLNLARALTAQAAWKEQTAPQLQAHDTDHFVQPAAGILGQVTHDLAISEPATLLRAAAIGHAADTLTAGTQAQSQRRAAALDVPAGHPTRAAGPGQRQPGTLPCRPANTSDPTVLSDPGRHDSYLRCAGRKSLL
jgi:hypothetical protein